MLRTINRDVLPRHEFSLLVCVPVDYEVKQVQPNTGVIDKGASLRGGTIGCDGMPGAFQLGQQCDQLVSEALDIFLKVSIEAELLETVIELRLERGSYTVPLDSAATHE